MIYVVRNFSTKWARVQRIVPFVVAVRSVEIKMNLGPYRAFNRLGKKLLVYGVPHFGPFYDRQFSMIRYPLGLINVVRTLLLNKLAIYEFLCYLQADTI